MINSSTTNSGRAAVQFGWSREELEITRLKEVFGEEDKEKDTQPEMGRVGPMEFLRRVLRRTEEAHGKQYLRILGHSRFSCWKITPFDWN